MPFVEDCAMHDYSLMVKLKYYLPSFYNSLFKEDLDNIATFDNIGGDFSLYKSILNEGFKNSERFNLRNYVVLQNHLGLWLGGLMNL